ncbi:MAG: drug/metabolite transporter (DMT)-like permease [Flavobacteriales bacterium]
MKSVFHYQLALHATVFVWGFTGIIGDLISLEALPLVWYRMLIALITLFIYLKWVGAEIIVDIKTTLALLATGVVTAAHWITFFHAIKISNVSVALACLSSGALFASMLEPIVFKRRIRPYELVLGVLVVVGLYTIFFFEGDHYFWGIITAITSACLASIFSIVNGKYIQRIRPGVISIYEMLGGWLAVSIYLLLDGRLLESNFFILNSSDWFYLVILGTICTAVAFVIGVKVMKKLSPFTVILSTNMEPVYGIVLALLINGEKEHMSPQFYYGTLGIISAIVINALVKKRINKGLKALIPKNAQNSDSDI